MPLTYWLTGLPQSGKTTLARLICETIKSAGGRAQLLDGDEIREAVNFHGFGDEDRRKHALYVALTARMLNSHGIWVAVALVYPFRKDRGSCKELLGASFVECFVDCPVNVCASRDTKGLYKKAALSEIKNLTGYNAPYESPQEPDFHFHTDQETPAACLKRLMPYVEGR